MVLSKTIQFSASDINVGNKYWKLLILGFEKRKKKHWTIVYAICECECGNKIKCKKNTIARWKKDCWCTLINDEAHKQHLKENKAFDSKRYWIHRRCRERNKNIKNNCYKGIVVEWKDKKEFKKDMYDGFINHIKKFGLENTTLDRIDNNKNYCKENCRWATREEQYTNMKKSITIEINWRKFTPNMLAKEYWISPYVARKKIKKYLNGDISLEKIL